MRMRTAWEPVRRCRRNKFTGSPAVVGVLSFSLVVSSVGGVVGSAVTLSGRRRRTATSVISSRASSWFVTCHSLKYSSTISSREARRMARFQYPGRVNMLSKRESARTDDKISRMVRELGSDEGFG